MKIDKNGMCALSDEDYSYHSRAPKQKRTNADRVRAMSDEELAKQIAEIAEYGAGRCAPGCDCVNKRCEDAWLDWLKREGE